MTCIVGIEHAGHVYLGGDSAAVNHMDIFTVSDEKVFKNDEFLMGYTTSFRMGQLLRYGFTPPEHSSKKTDMQYLVTDFIDAVRELFRDKGFATKQDPENAGDQGGTFLLGYRGGLYGVEDEFNVFRNDEGFAAIGCGAFYALGSLYSTRHVKDPIERLSLALEAAQKFSSGVRAPFRFVCTKSDGYVEPKKKP